MAEIATVAVAASSISSYRVKFHRNEFLQLVDIAKPKIIYRRKKNHFFAYDSFLIDSQ